MGTVRGMINKYPDICYSIKGKTRKVKPLAQIGLGLCYSGVLRLNVLALCFCWEQCFEKICVAWDTPYSSWRNTLSINSAVNFVKSLVTPTLTFTQIFIRFIVLTQSRETCTKETRIRFLNKIQLTNVSCQNILWLWTELNDK